MTNPDQSSYAQYALQTVYDKYNTETIIKNKDLLNTVTWLIAVRDGHDQLSHNEDRLHPYMLKRNQLVDAYGITDRTAWLRIPYSGGSYHKVETIKAIRQIYQLGLKEAKDVVESYAPRYDGRGEMFIGPLPWREDLQARLFGDYDTDSEIHPDHRSNVFLDLNV